MTASSVQSQYRIDKEQYLNEVYSLPFEPLTGEESAALAQILRLPVLKKTLRICKDVGFVAHDTMMGINLTSLDGIARAIQMQGQAKGTELCLEAIAELGAGLHLSQISDIDSLYTEQE